MEKRMSPLMLYVNSKDEKKVKNLEHYQYRRELYARLGRSSIESVLDNAKADAINSAGAIRLNRDCTFNSLPPEMQNEDTARKFLAAAKKDDLIYDDEINEFTKYLEGVNGHPPATSAFASVIEGIIGFVSELTLDEILTNATTVWELMKKCWARECDDFVSQQTKVKKNTTEAKAQTLRANMFAAKLLPSESNAAWKKLAESSPKDVIVALLSMIDNYSPEEMFRLPDMGNLMTYLKDNHKEKFESIKYAYMDKLREKQGLPPVKKK